MTTERITTGSFDLSKTPIHLNSIAGAESPAMPLKIFGFDGPVFQTYIDQHCKSGPGRLLMIESSNVNWPIWECHTLGDEIIIVLEGKGTFIQEIGSETGSEQRRIPISKGVAVINPQGVWHTADIDEPVSALYITPTAATEHRER